VLTTTGALPTGLTAGGTYYLIAAGLAANTFRVSATAGGSAISRMQTPVSPFSSSARARSHRSRTSP
ncbi:MAG: hypothetical protein ACK47M_21265, partial [Caldilinea sp.]